MSTETEPGHGNSPAAWTAVLIMIVGVTVGTVAFFLELSWLVWASAGVVLLGAIVGFVMARIGYGVDGSRTTAKKPH